MEKMSFKSSLFGFNRRQVLDYVNQTCAAYEQQLAQQTQAYDTYREQAQANLQEMATSLQNSRDLCANQKQELEAVHIQLDESQASLSQALLEVEQGTARVQVLQEQVATLTQDAVEKDQVIAKQALEVSRLQEMVSKLEEEFAPLRAEADQSSALVQCLNVLHERNRELLAQIARLEVKLEDITRGGQVETYKRDVSKQQQSVVSTEQLFAAVRKEIGEALASISSKIQSGGIAESEDGNYFVDMANL
ncbi:MAG: hypothetical protein IKM39_00800 [Clostridia bacterium]|nr:hypothetical protein [Clostridia bacterium]